MNCLQRGHSARVEGVQRQTQRTDFHNLFVYHSKQQHKLCWTPCFIYPFYFYASVRRINQRAAGPHWTTSQLWLNTCFWSRWRTLRKIYLAILLIAPVRQMQQRYAHGMRGPAVPFSNNAIYAPHALNWLHLSFMAHIHNFGFLMQLLPTHLMQILERQPLL